MKKHFRFLSGDVDFVTYGGLFYREVGQERYHVLELDNWHQHERDPPLTYMASLSEVDLAAIPRSLLREAYSSCGWSGDEDFLQGRSGELAKVECLYRQGSKAPLWDRSGNNYRKLMQEGRAESHRLDHPEAHEEAMSRPVNQVGSTAREYSQGDITSALLRGMSAGEERACLVARIQGAEPEAIEEFKGTPVPDVGRCSAATIRIRSVPSDDPLAYTMGYFRAVTGRGLEVERGQLAVAYVEGYQFGVEVKCGKEPKPTWHSR